MQLDLHRRTRRSRFEWLLSLALLLPLAQSLAARHELSHVVAGQRQGVESPQAAHAASCELCLVAATIGAGALPPPATAATAPSADAALPRATAVAAWLSTPAAAYRSRAPPLSLS